MERKVSPVPIYYENYINYMEVAAILVNKVNKMCVDSKELAHVMAGENFNMDELKDELYALFPEDMVIELMNSEFGQGILMGIYLSQTYGSALDQMQEADEK